MLLLPWLCLPPRGGLGDFPATRKDRYFTRHPCREKLTSRPPILGGLSVVSTRRPCREKQRSRPPILGGLSNFNPRTASSPTRRRRCGEWFRPAARRPRAGGSW